MTITRSIEIFYFKAGGGHLSAMNALRDVLMEKYPGWSVKPVDLADILKPIDPVYKTTRLLAKTRALPRSFHLTAKSFKINTRQIQDIYNFFLQRDMTRGFGALLPLLQRYIRMPANAARMRNLVQDRWRAAGLPDLVVSVIPNFNAVMFDALRQLDPHIPYVTILTDMVDLPPHFWMERQDQHIICGTQTAYRQAVDSGYYAADKIFAVSGMILKKYFYEIPRADSPTLRSIGLTPDRPTILIMFGGNGSSVSRKIVHAPDQWRTWRAIYRHVRQQQTTLSKPSGQARLPPRRFVVNVADYMRLADIFIGKPGPGSISEAVHMGCPIIVERNESTMPQESPNVDWVLENGLGLAVEDFDSKEIIAAVRKILADIALYKNNIARMPENNAVYEIAILLNQIIHAATAYRGWARESDDLLSGSDAAFPILRRI